MLDLILAPWRRRRRRALRARPVPPGWTEILARNVPFVAALSDAARARLLGDIQVLVAEKHFIGAGGLEITEEIQVTIAATAARLIQHLDVSVYDPLTEIIVYPGAYRHPDRETDTAVLGEAHPWGVVVLSWQAVLDGLRRPDDGRDTALHEFAHVLDRESGAFDGTPTLRAHDHYRAWATVMTRHFEKLRRRDRRTRAILREYGAINEAEFFAVVTEVFFERPDQLRARVPDLHAELERFYGASD